VSGPCYIYNFVGEAEGGKTRGDIRRNGGCGDVALPEAMMLECSASANVAFLRFILSPKSIAYIMKADTKEDEEQRSRQIKGVSTCVSALIFL